MTTDPSAGKATKSTTSEPFTKTDAARILIVDDHPMVRQGLSMLLEKEPDLTVCASVGSTDEAMTAFRDQAPDLVVMDITLKDGNGLELVKQMRALDEEAKVLVSSMHDEVLFAERSLNAEALGFINKEESTESVVEAVRKVLKGKVYLSPAMSERMLSRSVGHQTEVGASPIEALSDRELEVFELIGHGMQTGQIAKQLSLSPKTIETYRENIKLKLHLQNSGELVRRAVVWTVQGA